MSDLGDLQKAVNDMTQDELLAKIREIRKDRRLPKTSAKKLAKKAKAKTKTPKKSIEQKMQEMSPDKMEALLLAAQKRLQEKK